MTEVEKYVKENHIQNVKYDEPLSNHTSFRVGGIAKVVVTPANKKEIMDLIEFLKGESIPFKVLGKGSNILASDKIYEGVIIKSHNALNYLEVNNEEIIVGSGYSLVKLAYEMANYQLTGIEFLGGIPGSIGGAVYMNAGAYKKEMRDVITEVTLINNQGVLTKYKNEDLKYSYRKSILQKQKPLLIIEAKLRLEKGNKLDILKLLMQRHERRVKTQPLEYPNGGSTFRNPKDTQAYLLIDKAGLRGCTIGGAMVSNKHCNFIVNYNKANSLDVKNLIDHIKKIVYLKTGKRLRTEIELFNW